MSNKKLTKNWIKKLLRQARNEYRNLSEGKKQKREYWRNRNKNISEGDKQKLKEYEKTIETQENWHFYHV